MFGYRARIGYISPSVMELNGYDFYRIVPEGVGLIAVTCMVEGWKEDAYKKALAQVEACARELGRRSCDFIIHGGAPLVLSQGKGFETKLLRQLQELTGQALSQMRALIGQWRPAGEPSAPQEPAG